MRMRSVISTTGRTDAGAIEPVLYAEGRIATFGPSYAAWLDAAYARLASR